MYSDWGDILAGYLLKHLEMRGRELSLVGYIDNVEEKYAWDVRGWPCFVGPLPLLKGRVTRWPPTQDPSNQSHLLMRKLSNVFNRSSLFFVQCWNQGNRLSSLSL